MSFYVVPYWPNDDHQHIVFTSATASTYTLGDATLTPGLHVTLKNQAAGTVTVSAPNSQTIDGSATLSLAGLHTKAVVFSDGDNWNIIST
jgi:hypothetical protein